MNVNNNDNKYCKAGEERESFYTVVIEIGGNLYGKQNGGQNRINGVEEMARSGKGLLCSHNTRVQVPSTHINPGAAACICKDRQVLATHRPVSPAKGHLQVLKK